MSKIRGIAIVLAFLVVMTVGLSAIGVELGLNPFTEDPQCVSADSC